jgi:pilus assembly protein Flp/PilA
MKLWKVVKRFVKEEEGLETVEYAIIAGLIVSGTIVTIVAIGAWVSGKFTDLEAELKTADTPAT